MRAVGVVDRRGRDRVQTVNAEPSKTIQSDAVKADIHEVLRPYGVVGLSQHLDNVDDLFLDVSEFTDYADMARQNKEAEAMFMKLPAKVRKAFNNDAYEWLDSAHDPEKRNNVLEKLGLVDSATGSTSGGTPDSSEAAPSGSSDASST